MPVFVKKKKRVKILQRNNQCFLLKYAHKIEWDALIPNPYWLVFSDSDLSGCSVFSLVNRGDRQGKREKP